MGMDCGERGWGVRRGCQDNGRICSFEEWQKALRESKMRGCEKNNRNAEACGQGAIVDDGERELGIRN